MKSLRVRARKNEWPRRLPDDMRARIKRAYRILEPLGASVYLFTLIRFMFLSYSAKFQAGKEEEDEQGNVDGNADEDGQCVNHVLEPFTHECGELCDSVKYISLS